MDGSRYSELHRHETLYAGFYLLTFYFNVYDVLRGDFRFEGTIRIRVRGVRAVKYVNLINLYRRCLGS